MADTHSVTQENEEAGTDDVGVDEFKTVYLECLQLIERLHRRFLDVVKGELDRLGIADVSNVQSLIHYAIGDSEMSVGELTTRGYYLGSNVTYNLKKLVENGYLEQHRSEYDRRSFRIKLSEKGLVLRDTIDGLLRRHVGEFDRGLFGSGDIQSINDTLNRLERFWSDEIRIGIR